MICVLASLNAGFVAVMLLPASTMKTRWVSPASTVKVTDLPPASFGTVVMPNTSRTIPIEGLDESRDGWLKPIKV